MIELKVFDAEALRLLKKAPDEIQDSFNRLLKASGLAMRNAVRDNIRTQGKTFRDPWPGPGKWIRAKKGVRKALSGQEQHIQYQVVGGGRVGVFYDGPGGTRLINRHHTGFTREADGRWYGISLKQPHHLSRKPNKSGPYRWGFIKFRWTNSSVVPRRRIWPTVQMTHRLLAPVTALWAKRLQKELAT